MLYNGKGVVIYYQAVMEINVAHGKSLPTPLQVHEQTSLVLYMHNFNYFTLKMSMLKRLIDLKPGKNFNTPYFPKWKKPDPPHSPSPLSPHPKNQQLLPQVLFTFKHLQWKLSCISSQNVIPYCIIGHVYSDNLYSDNHLVLLTGKVQGNTMVGDGQVTYSDNCFSGGAWIKDLLARSSSLIIVNCALHYCINLPTSLLIHPCHIVKELPPWYILFTVQNMLIYII